MDLQRLVDDVHACPLDELAEQLPLLVARAPQTLLALATRIGATGDMPPEELTSACTAQVAGLETSLEPAVLIETFGQTLRQPHVEVALQWLFDIGFMETLFPDLEATKHLQQEAGRHHKDVWEHTKLVVKQAVPRSAVRWAALLHDIGKVPTRTFTDKGVHFHGHAEVGARMFDKISRRYSFDNSLRRKIRFLIKYHLRSAQYEDDWTDSAVRRFSRDMSEHLDDLLALSRADITSKRPGRRKELLAQISGLSDRIDALRAEDAKKPNLPKGLGLEIMAHFGLPPSKTIGNLITTLNAHIDAGELESQQSPAHYLDWLEKSELVKKNE